MDLRTVALWNETVPFHHISSTEEDA